MDLVTTAGTAPAAVPLSSETTATIDDVCSYTPGANLVGTVSASDFVTPSNSAYFYRLPGADGVCGTADDTVRMVKLGMSATDAPISALMPIAVARSAAGAISGYVAVQGATLTLFDSNFANPRVLYTASAPIVQAYRLSTPPQIVSTSSLFVVDGRIVFLDYAAGTSRGPLFTLARPAETPPTATGSDALYFVDTVITGTGAQAVTAATLYKMPLDGSAAPSALLSEPVRIQTVQLPPGSTTLAYSSTPAGGVYTIKTVSTAGGATRSVLAGNGNTGSFTAIGAGIYWSSSQRTETAPRTFVFSDPRSGVVRNDGTVLLPAVVNSRFEGNAERSDSLVVTRLFRVRGLSPVTTVVASNGDTITDAAAAGSLLDSIDISSNLFGPTIGTVPSSTIAFLGTGLVGDSGFIAGTTRNSTANPATRELLYLNATLAGSLIRVTTNLP